MYAFLSHTSACEALRYLGRQAPNQPRWPEQARELPRHRNTVTNQGMFKEFCQTVNMSAYGITRTPVDLLVAGARERSRGRRAYFHTWKHDIPEGAFLRLEETLLTSSPEFILVQMAGYHSRRDTQLDEFHAERAAITQLDYNQELPYDDPFVWDTRRQIVRMILVASEFMGSYRLGVAGGSTSYRMPALMTPATLALFITNVPHIYGANRLVEMQHAALVGSASPMETALALMLSLGEEYGGFGLSKPLLNYELSIHKHSTLWSGGPVITPDLLWREARVALEYDSDEFHGAHGSRKLAQDAARANVLSAMGYTVMRVTTDTVRSLPDIERLAQQIALALGETLPAVDDVLRIRRAKLFDLLVHP